MLYIEINQLKQIVFSGALGGTGAPFDSANSTAHSWIMGACVLCSRLPSLLNMLLTCCTSPSHMKGPYTKVLCGARHLLSHFSIMALDKSIVSSLVECWCCVLDRIPSPVVLGMSFLANAKPATD